jgi:hypothetical protein
MRTVMTMAIVAMMTVVTMAMVAMAPLRADVGR